MLLLHPKRQLLLALLIAPTGSAFTCRPQDLLYSNALSRSVCNVVIHPIAGSGTSPSSHENDDDSSPLYDLSIDQPQKRRNHNEAMSDTAFLRKRTADLLRVTSVRDSADEAYDESNNIMGGGMKVGRKTFNFLFDAWAFSGELDAADQALALLQRMEELQARSDHSYNNIIPDVRSYTKVINAVSRSMRADAGEIAESILEKMESVSSSGINPSAKPNTFTYTAVVEAYANSGQPGAASKAEEMCERMIHLCECGDSDIRPTARCFNAAIYAHAKSGAPGAAQNAQALFDRMEELYMAGIDEAKPSTFNYNTLITAWANCEEEGSAQRAQDVLNRMQTRYKNGNFDCKPTTVSYNAVIDAHAKSGEVDGARRAEEVLRTMEQMRREGRNIGPNTRSFNSVINAWAKSPDPDAAIKAQSVLDIMTDLYEEGDESVRPDVHSFCSVINAWARSPHPGKAERADYLFREMSQLYKAGNERLKPNIVAVNAVINACAYTGGDFNDQNRAMEIAHKYMKKVESSDIMALDQVTYGTFLKVCANQMPASNTREQVVEVIFKKCIRDGQLGNLALQEIKAMGPPELYERLIGHSIEEEIDFKHLPQDWWSNVVEGKWSRRRRKMS